MDFKGIVFEIRKNVEVLVTSDMDFNFEKIIYFKGVLVVQKRFKKRKLIVPMRIKEKLKRFIISVR